jgi:hypothetical protein
VKTLVCTFGEGDFEKTIEAMRRLPYEMLLLVGENGMAETESFARIRAFEELSGHEVEAEIVDGGGFMDMVNQVSTVLDRHSKVSPTGDRPDILLNISGGSKLLGDAALFAAFRLGIRACHCDGRMTMLPVVNGATATDRFTPAQSRFIRVLDRTFTPLDDLVQRVGSPSRQAVERVMRELRRLGLLRTDVRDGRILVSLSEAGAEVSRALRRTALR